MPANGRTGMSSLKRFISSPYRAGGNVGKVVSQENAVYIQSSQQAQSLIAGRRRGNLVALFF
jgi:hypothetical protein